MTSIKELLELGDKRTQGEWCNEHDEDGSCDWIWADHGSTCTNIAKRVRSTTSPDTIESCEECLCNDCEKKLKIINKLDKWENS